MSVLVHTLRSHDLLELAPQQNDVLHLLRASGRNLRAAVPAKWISLWWPLRGDIEMLGGDCRWLLRRRELTVWREGALHAGTRRAGWWLAVCGSPAAWARHLRPRPGERAMEIFPWEGPCPRELCRPLLRLARAAARPAADATNCAAAADMFCAALAEQQRHALSELLLRCSGRTLQRKQQTLLRLLHVRHLIHRQDSDRLDLAYLSASANYSPCHLIRGYRRVFGETPSEHAARLRLERAWALVRDTRMPVCEITELLGFESQSAFCRAFKTAHGMTTSEVRQRLAA